MDLVTSTWIVPKTMTQQIVKSFLPSFAHLIHFTGCVQGIGKRLSKKERARRSLVWYRILRKSTYLCSQSTAYWPAEQSIWCEYVSFLSIWLAG